MATVDLVVDCPHCRDPFAALVQEDVDIHSGATYKCAACGGSIVLSAQTPQEYSRAALRKAANADTD